MAVTIKRGFTDIAEGPVHYRTINPARAASGRRSCCCTASPLSSLLMVKFGMHLAATRDVIALDTLGQGFRIFTPATPQSRRALHSAKS